MKRYTLFLLFAGCLLVPDAQAQIRDTLLWVVAPFEVPDRSDWWWHGGAEAIQDVFATELTGRGRTVLATRRANRRQAEKAGYRLIGAVTEYGPADDAFVAAVNARIIDAQTGEILWRDEAGFKGSDEELQASRFKGTDEEVQAMFDKVMRPLVLELTASIKAADL